MPQTWPIWGDEMRFKDSGGLDFERAAARAVFNVDDVLVVDEFQIGSSYSTVSFRGYPGEWNSVMFELVEERGFANIGIASAVPGMDGYTMVVFKADAVPAGTWVYEKIED